MNLFSPKPPWYISGLAFECGQCGRCCSGPEEGYVWVTDEEITRIAAFLNMTAEQFRGKHLKRVAGKYTIVEHQQTHDCIFLQPDPLQEGSRTCVIYSIRPAQCRTWPFWQTNLNNPDSWCRAAQRCKGINRGKVHSYDEIQSKIKPQP